MQRENEIPVSERYLLCNCIFSGGMVKQIKSDVKKFMSDREKDDCYRQFINWKQKKNEIVVLTMYAYADLLLPKKFDTVFHIRKPDESVNAEFSITQAVLDGRFPVNEINHGHKHVVIIEFEGAVPGIFDRDKVELGFCNSSDFNSIKEKLTAGQD
jgi:hypothetical protein